MSNFLRQLPGLAALALSAAALAVSLGLVGGKQEAKPVATASFSTEQASEIGKISHDYLLANPEIIRDAIQALQAKEEAAKSDLQAQALKEHKDAVFADANDPVAGNPQGDVTLVEFFDYKCPYCKQVSPALEALLNEDKKLKVVFKEFPILSDGSVLAARAALAAGEQGKYLTLHQALMGYRGQLDEASIASVAASVGIDTAKLLEDMKSPAITDRLKAVHELALALNIRSTPTFIIGDKVLPGAMSVDDLKSVIADTRKGS